jgi:glutamate:GABA antiporter
VAKLVAALGFLTTTLTIFVSLIPQPDEPNKPLAVLKIVGGSAALVGVGIWIYFAGKRRAVREQVVQIREL